MNGDAHLQTEIVKFRNPHSLKNKVGRVLWKVAWVLLFRPTPALFGAWRSLLLKLFGAKIGRARLHPSVQIWAPWRLTIGHDVFIDRGVNLYNAYGITIGDRVVISMGVLLCTASHDHRISTFPLIGGRITIGNDTWLAAEAFVGPGVTIGDGAVVGARGVVVRDVEPWTVVAGNPARFIAKREVSPDPGTAAVAANTTSMPTAPAAQPPTQVQAASSAPAPSGMHQD